MAYESASSRWWENYLVRYLMPSIAGIGIVAWLTAVGPADLRETLFFGKGPASLDAPTLTLLVLYGNLYCYVASYPILCFHATRVTDFHQYEWLPRLTDGYISAALFGAGIILASLMLSGVTRVVVSFLLAAAFVFIQLIRIRSSLQRPSIHGYKKRPSALIYAFLVTLAMRRGIVNRKTTTTTPAAAPADPDTDDEPEPSQTTCVEEESRWQREFIDSYRHMREHGNSGFIFALELGLAAACYGIVRLPKFDGPEVLSVLGALFALWSVPAVFVHLLGQHLERRYSIFDRRLPPP
jgi:hypothetical protein